MKTKAVLIGRKKYINIKVDDVFYLKADGNYTDIIFNDTKIKITKNLKQTVLDIFSEENFVKISRYLVVNINKIDEIDLGRKRYVMLSNGAILKPSLRMKNNLIN